ncbi:MAG: GntR family transcriptional regulator [Janthinobacterium lividum]
MDDELPGRSYLRDEVFEAVRAELAVMASSIEAPIRIREEHLAKKLGVSRTPVREALMRLELLGMVSMQPRRGALLTPASESEYLEWLQLREELEGFATREATLNASQRDVDRLRALFSPFEGGVTEALQQDYALANVNFHREIISLAQNSLLERVWKSFGHRQMVRTRTIERLGRAPASLSEHLAIIDAMQERDAAHAAELSRAHVRSLATRVKNSGQLTPASASHLKTDLKK